MSFFYALRSRLLVAMGLGTLSGPVAGCGGDTSSPQSGSADARADAKGTGAAMSTGGIGSGGTAGAGGAPNGGVGGTGSGGTSSGGTNANGGASSGGTNAMGGTTQNGGSGGLPTVRRPFLVGASMRSSEVSERDDWLASISPVEVSDPRTAALLAEAWLKDGLEEHASVAAFARFTLLLLSIGAPPDLVAGSQRASLDEIKHARACFALARRYGNADVGPTALDVADSIGALSLADIAALTVAEGCVGETLGALMAAEQLEHASDPDVERILRRIARDEARHAELAWKFLAWALRAGGNVVVTASHDAFRATVADLERMPVVDYGIDVTTWHSHGRMTCAETRALSRRGVKEVISPCFDALTRSLMPNRERAPRQTA